MLIDVWPSLPPGLWLRPPAELLPFPLAEPEHRLYESVGHAMADGLRALGLGHGDEVILPARHGGPEVQALVGAGLRPVFIDRGLDLEPEDPELERLVGPRTRALFLIHHLGFPQDGRRWRRWCDDRGILLLEDATDAWLAAADGEPSGSSGHLAVFSPHRTVGIPRGAILNLDAVPPSGSHHLGRDLRQLAAGHARWLALHSGAVWSHGEELTGRTAVPPRGLSATVSAAIARLAYDDPAAGRRANYRVLLDELGERAPRPFAVLPDGASPLAFPLSADDGDGLIRRLRARGVVAIPLSPATTGLRAPDRSQTAAATVGLPVHQQLSVRDLDRIIDAASGRPARSAALRVERVGRLEDLEDEWDKLAARTGNVFATREWISTWWRHFGAGRELRLLACREPGGRLVAIVPAFESARRPVPTIRFIGHTFGDRVGPICAPADVGRAARALAQALDADILGAHVLIGEQLPAEERWGGLLGATTVRREASPILDIAGASFDEWLAARSRNFREQVRRRERGLMREHRLEYRLCDSAQRLEGDLETLFDLHAARWGAESDAFAPHARPFHRDFAALAFERGWLRLWSMELDGRPVAAWQGFRYGDADWYYQAGRDPAYHASAVGFVLLAHSIRDAMAAGVREYRLGRGDQEYKRRFSDRDPGLEMIVAARGVGGRLARASAAAAAAMPRAWRHRLRGLAG